MKFARLSIRELVQARGHGKYSSCRQVGQKGLGRNRKHLQPRLAPARPRCAPCYPEVGLKVSEELPLVYVASSQEVFDRNAAKALCVTAGVWG